MFIGHKLKTMCTVKENPLGNEKSCSRSIPCTTSFFTSTKGMVSTPAVYYSPALRMNTAMYCKEFKCRCFVG